jgi:CHAT domain-containing protein
MTNGSPRPGAQLLRSLIAEERRGLPGPAREAAIAAARADPQQAHVHLFDAAYAALVAGEPRAAQGLLDEAAAAAPDDEVWRRRAAAGRWWIWSVDCAWYPGDTGGEVSPIAVRQAPARPEPAPGDPETVLLEASVNASAVLRTTRVMLATMPNRSAIEPLLEAAHPELQLLNEALVGPSTAWPTVVWADVLQRAGLEREAGALLADVRSYASAAARDTGDRVGLVCTHLVEGDWYTTPGSSPEALGFALAPPPMGPPSAIRRDDARAAAAYDSAAAALGDADEPRLRGALALRRAALAWEHADHVTQLFELDVAGEAFERAGDTASAWLVAVHRLLADVASGKVARTRRAHGTAFDLTPQGTIAALLRWCEEAGSVAWTTGLGRLLQRAAERWEALGDYDRAEVTYGMAVPLVPASGGEASATVLVELAGVDARQRLGVRATTRLRQGLATLPPVEDFEREPVEWMRQLSIALILMQAHMDEGASGAGAGAAGLESAIARARAVLAVPDAPAPGAAGDITPARLRAIEESRAADTFETLAAVNQQELPEREREMIAITADTARTRLVLAEAYLAFERAGEAMRDGAQPTAERWFDEALAKADSGGSEGASVAVMILAASDRLDEARARLRRLLDSAEVPTEFFAPLAVRARDYAAAIELFSGRLAARDRGWLELADHAEAALGAGDPALAASLADAAVEDFETRFAGLHRDADRVLASDDVAAAHLYLIAAQAQLALAERTDHASATLVAEDARERAFQFGDRARSLALAALVADVSGDEVDDVLARAWRQAAAEWQAAYERLHSAYVREAPEDEVSRAIGAMVPVEHAIVAVEAEIEERVPGALERHRRSQPPAHLSDIQGALPAGSALLEYQLLDRDLLVWAVTAHSVVQAEKRVPSGAIARLVNAVRRACANGDPGEDAEELAELLLAPAASVLEACPRVVVVPYGRLNGLPFHVLPFAGAPLGVTHVVSYLPAASLLLKTAPDKPVRTRTALVVGDPAFDPDLHPSLRRLQGAAVEAEAVARTYAVDPLIDEAAAEPAIRAKLGGTDLLHLAAHGRLDGIAPSSSSIVLAGPDELTVADLMGLRVDAELAVLSACDSGRGRETVGGDVVGLARGLIASGVRRSVVSLWPVDDAAACVTMALFHDRLAGGIAPAPALQATQKAVRAMSGSEIAAHYVDLGGDWGDVRRTRRRGAVQEATGGVTSLPLDPDLIDDLTDDEPLETLTGATARIWAPFVVIGT